MTGEPQGSGGLSAVETPSGKGAGDENFPVGSVLLPAHLRPHVATFYAFARAIDDIADNPRLGAEDKIARLDGFDAELLGPTGQEGFEKASAMRESLAATGVVSDHCRDLIRAFKQDAVKNRYENWDELMGYCRLSAAPVGRYLIDLHGGNEHGYATSDALCNALQVINHLQDCGDDYRDLDRVYIPLDWLTGAGGRVEDLDGKSCSKGLRRAIDQCLVGTAELMIEAYKLPGQIPNRRLRLEAAVIVRLADSLIWHLSGRDPLAERIELTKMDAFMCLVRGVLGGLFRR